MKQTPGSIHYWREAGGTHSLIGSTGAAISNTFHLSKQGLQLKLIKSKAGLKADEMLTESLVWKYNCTARCIRSLSHLHPPWPHLHTAASHKCHSQLQRQQPSLGSRACSSTVAAHTSCTTTHQAGRAPRVRIPPAQPCSSNPHWLTVIQTGSVQPGIYLSQLPGKPCHQPEGLLHALRLKSLLTSKT